MQLFFAKSFPADLLKDFDACSAALARPGPVESRAGPAMASSVPCRGLFSILLACLLSGICVAFNAGFALNCGITRMSPITRISSPRKAFNLRMQEDSTSVTKGFSNRREQQKADALMRQKSKQSKIEKVQSDEPSAEPVSVNTAAEVTSESAPLRKVSNPKALEKLKDSAQLEKEKRLMAAKQAGLPMIDRVGQGLPLIEKVLLIPVCTQLAIENAGCRCGRYQTVSCSRWSGRYWEGWGLQRHCGCWRAPVLRTRHSWSQPSRR